MTNQELAAALRLCGSEPCAIHCQNECPFFKGRNLNLCIPAMTSACADALENHESHVMALQQEIEKLRGQIILRNDELLKLREQVPRWIPVTEPPKEVKDDG